jgi:hypothetical protein
MSPGNAGGMGARTETDERHLRRAVELAGAARDAGPARYDEARVPVEGS